MPLNESIVEDATLEWFKELGYVIGHGPELAPGESAAERDSFGDVVLVGRLREAIHRLNPHIPQDAQEEALKKVLRPDNPSCLGNNRNFHRMLRDGVEVEYKRPDGSIAGDRVKLVDFDDVELNDWFVVNQFTVIEGQHKELIKLAKDLDAATKAGKEMGLTDDEKAFYDALAANESAVRALGVPELKVIAAELITKVRQSVTIDWTLRESARAKIRVMVKPGR